MRVLSSLKARPLGASHAASRALTCFGLLTAEAQSEQIVGVPDQHRGCRHGLPSSGAGAGSGPRRPLPSRARPRSTSTGLITPP